jgi:hypothetical protein
MIDQGETVLVLAIESLRALKVAFEETDINDFRVGGGHRHRHDNLLL